MDREILRFMDRKLEEGQIAALITVEEQEGSAPGTQGSLLALAEDGSSAGTCGGGALEHILRQRVMAGMEEAKHFRFQYDLVSDLGMVCGGAASGYVRYFSQGRQLIIFGAGHCSEALAKLCQNQRFSLSVVDSREGFAENEGFAQVRFIRLTPAQALTELKFGPDTYIVVANWGHELDAQTYRLCLDKEYAFLGGLGSREKARQIKEQLMAEGYAEAKVNALHLPIGIDLADGSPEEIAVSILAELLLVKNGKELKLKAQS